MTEELNSINPEQQRELALEIYEKLQTFRNKAHITGFMRGGVIYPECIKRVKVFKLSTNADFEQKMFKERGYADEDLQSGLFAVIESEFRNPDFPRVPYVQEPALQYYNVSGNGKVMGSNYSDRRDQFYPSKLETIHIDALQTIARLSMIPRQIIEIFGSHEEFKRTLGDPDMRGIDRAEFTPTQILYSGGLREFVRALELRAKGQLERLDTSLHALRDSLDERDHFTKLFETLRKAQEQQDKPEV